MSFVSAAVRMYDSLFARGGSDALYKAGGAGDGTACKVILAEPDVVERLGQDRAILPTARIRVRRSEIDEIAIDDTFDILDDDGAVVETLRVIADPIMDRRRMVYSCEAVRA